MIATAAPVQALTEAQAMAAAREFVPDEYATVSNTMIGSFEVVFEALANRPTYLPQPAPGGPAEVVVWGVQFKLRLEICGPEGATCEARDGFRTIFLDSLTGTWLRTTTFAPNPEAKN